MGQISEPRFWSYSFKPGDGKLVWRQNPESDRAKSAWAHTPFGSIILVILTAIFGLILRNTIATKPVTNICYQCTVYQVNK